MIQTDILTIAVTFFKILMVTGLTIIIVTAMTIVINTLLNRHDDDMAWKLIRAMYEHNSYFIWKNKIMNCKCTDINFIYKPLSPFYSYCINYGKQKSRRLLVYRWSKLAKEIDLIFETAPTAEQKEATARKEISHKIADYIRGKSYDELKRFFNFEDNGEDND